MMKGTPAHRFATLRKIPIGGYEVDLFSDGERIAGGLDAARIEGLRHQGPFAQEEYETGRSINCVGVGV